jgi:hypothetical protein
MTRTDVNAAALRTVLREQTVGNGSAPTRQSIGSDGRSSTRWPFRPCGGLAAAAGVLLNRDAHRARLIELAPRAGRKEEPMRRKTVAILLSVLFALAAAAPAFAGSTGYEGQPGNQSSGGGGGGGGNTGYEGQPGNQGG